MGISLNQQMKTIQDELGGSPGSRNKAGKSQNKEWNKEFQNFSIRKWGSCTV